MADSSGNIMSVVVVDDETLLCMDLAQMVDELK